MDTSDSAEEKKTPMTQEEVENYILLAGQRQERWFTLRFTEESMNDDPTALALMESIADIIQGGIASMAMEERMAQAKADVGDHLN